MIQWKVVITFWRKVKPYQKAENDRMGVGSYFSNRLNGEVMLRAVLLPGNIVSRQTK